MKQVKLTEKNAKKYPVLYLVMFNMSGLHDLVYKLKLKADLPYSYWVDEDDNITIDIPRTKIEFGEIIKPKRELLLGWSIAPCRSDYLTPNKAEAELVLNSILVYRDHIKRHI